MKKLFTVVLAVMVTGSVFAIDFTKWNSSVEDSKWLFNAGVGYGLGISVPVSAEYLLPVDFPIGVLVEVTPSWHNTESGGAQVNNFWLNALAGVNYHPDFGLENMDLYFGVKLGYAYYSYMGTEMNMNTLQLEEKRFGSGAFGFGTHIGFSYFFTDKFGVNVKVGYPTYISVSAALKL